MDYCAKYHSAGVGHLSKLNGLIHGDCPDGKHWVIPLWAQSVNFTNGALNGDLSQRSNLLTIAVAVSGVVRPLEACSQLIQQLAKALNLSVVSFLCQASSRSAHSPLDLLAPS